LSEQYHDLEFLIIDKIVVFPWRRMAELDLAGLAAGGSDSRAVGNGVDTYRLGSGSGLRVVRIQNLDEHPLWRACSNTPNRTASSPWSSDKSSGVGNEGTCPWNRPSPRQPWERREDVGA